MQNGDYRTVATHEELTQYMEFIDPEFDARRTVWEQRLSAREELFSSSSTQGFEKIVFAVFQTGDVKRQVRTPCGILVNGRCSNSSSGA